MLLTDVLEKTPKAAATCFRHHPDLVEELKRLLPQSLDLTGTEKPAELFYLYHQALKQYPRCVCGARLSYVKFNVGYTATCGADTCVIDVARSKRIQTCQDKFGGNAPACSKTVQQKMKQTVLERYGVDSVQQLEHVREKTLITNQTRYGVDWSAQNPEVRKKTATTLKQRYGVDHALQDPQIKERQKKTHLEKSGFENNLQDPKVREKIAALFEIKYGGHPMRNDEVKNKLLTTNEQRYGGHSSKSAEVRNKISAAHKANFQNRMQALSDIRFLGGEDGYYHFLSIASGEQFTLSSVTYNRRIRSGEEVSPILNPLYQPKKQLEVRTYLEQIYTGPIHSNDTTVLGGPHLDIYLPQEAIAIEFNGIYWHSELYRDKLYHLQKQQQCSTSGVTLIHIFEDEWNEKRPIVESILANRLGSNKKKIYARQCVVKPIQSETCTEFLRQNHIQGEAAAKVKLGLFHEEQLVSVMTFGGLRIALGAKHCEHQWEMVRYCNTLFTSVIGGASKLFKHFLKNYPVEKIISYSDNRWFDGGLYHALGFRFEKESPVNYWYVKGRLRQHRFNFRKDKLIKEGYDPNKTEHLIMRERGYVRIYDCGNKRFVFTP